MPTTFDTYTCCAQSKDDAHRLEVYNGSVNPALVFTLKPVAKDDQDVSQLELRPPRSLGAPLAASKLHYETTDGEVVVVALQHIDGKQCLRIGMQPRTLIGVCTHCHDVHPAGLFLSCDGNADNADLLFDPAIGNWV